MATRNVWYTLVNVCGEELSSTDFVEMPTAMAETPDADTPAGINDIVAAFRKLVLRENPNLLAKFDASQLSLFANRAEYEAAKANELEPLAPGASITKYGMSESDAIIVVVPSPPTAPAEVMELLQQMMYTTFLETDSASSAQSESYKTKACEIYDAVVPSEDAESEAPAMLRCAVLDTPLPAELVDAAPVFRTHKMAFISKLVGIDDMADPRASLMLFKPLHHALDKFQITFHYDRELDAFRLKVLDEEVRSEPLLAKMTNKQRKVMMRGEKLSKNWRDEGSRLAPGTTFDLQTTFGDLDGRVLAFRSLTRPYKRFLNFHARLASAYAVGYEWVSPEEGKFEDFWSDGMSVDEKMEYYLNSL